MNMHRCVLLMLGLFLSCKTLAPPSNQQEILAERIAYYGHGMLFDKEMKEIKLGISSIKAIQDSMLAEIAKSEAKKPADDSKATIEKAQKLLQSNQLQQGEVVLLKSGIISGLLRNASVDLVSRYSWRNDALLSAYWNLNLDVAKQLRPEIIELLRQLRPPVIAGTPTRYMADCRTHRVPIPPDWAESGTAWVQQGTLTENLLQPGQYAAVWTFSDPSVRGACIALPRGSGGPGSPAGIICQSATTGHACFWDNKLRGVDPEEFIGWSGQRLVITDLKDGSNLNSACTGCHRGNNVFLISPDDATWAKVLRGPLSGSSTGTFTTRVETSSDNRGGHPRYIPITTLPERPGWENTFAGALGCSGACHETPVVSAPSMPPDCALPSFSDPSNCYGTP
jgi:hypothetical protein